MPSMYAHARFAREASKDLPEQLRLPVQRFARLFDVGAYGPDFFFFYQPLFKTKMGALGSQYHKMTGKAFFETAAKHLRGSTGKETRPVLLSWLRFGIWWN